jgi:predicted ATPase
VDAFPGGVFFVPLAGVPEAELVEGTIASTIGVRDLEELRDRWALVVVDNFEHVLEAAPALARPLVAGEALKLLVTSRAPLRIEGEREYPLEPLPDEDAVVLLSERARAVRPDFEPDEAAREICRRLDGLPLALELAAARLRSLGSEALLERLDQRLPVLTSGRRDAPDRQRSLRATIEWSYDLLEPELQAVFGRLGVFASFSLDGAEAVAGADLDAIDAVVEASLLKHVEGDRYLMLETIREFALERLDASGEGDDTRMRLLEHLTALAGLANLVVEADGPMRHELVVPERDNIRVALEWALGAGEVERALELVTKLENFWVSAGDPVEGRAWIEALLARADGIPPGLEALALRCLANCRAVAGDRDVAAELYERSARRFEEAGEELKAATADYRTAMQVYARDPERARRLSEKSHEYFRRVGFTKGEAGCVTLLGDLERDGSKPERSLELYERAIQLSRESGFTWWEAGTLLKRADALFLLGRHADAARDAAAGFRASRRMSMRGGMFESVAFIARAAAEAGDDAVAGRLWGAVEADAERTPLAGWEAYRDELVEPICARAGAGFRAAVSEGRKLSFEEASEAALAFAEREA